MRTLLFGLLILGGCSSLKKEDCVSMDWKTKGLTDAKEGYGRRISSYEAQCAKYGVEAETAAYEAGFTEGKALYPDTKRRPAGHRHGPPSAGRIR